MKRLIDCVCFLGKQELSFRGHDESESSLNKGNYLECLDLIRLYDPILDEHLRTATIFRGTAPSLQNDLIQAISDTIIDHIRQEVQNCHFVSIMLDETCNISCESQLSTVLRYVHKGEAKERFIEFTDVSADKTAAALFEHVVKIVTEFKIESKLVGQTYDGAAVMSGHLNGLQRKVQEKSPHAVFVHCYAQVLNLVLQQALNCLRECRLFFKTLSGMSAFFTKSPKRTKALNDFVKRRLPNVAPTRWCFVSRIVNTVCEERINLEDFFSYLSEDLEGVWDDDTVIKAKGFSAFLKEFKNVLLLEMFSYIFSLTDVLFNTLQSKSHDILSCSQKIMDTKNELQENRNSHFDNMWDAAVAKFAVTEENCTNEKQKRRKKDSDDKDSMKRMYFEIIDNVCNQIDLRYQSFKKLEFCNLLHFPKYSEYRSNFPDSLVCGMKETYSSLFDFLKLKSELIVVYVSTEFSNRSVHELVPFMEKNDLHTIFPETYKLAELILTIPSTTASVERSFSALKRIHTFLRNSQSQNRMTNLSIISIEKSVLVHLRERGTLYEAVIEVFKKKGRRLELEWR